MSSPEAADRPTGCDFSFSLSFLDRTGPTLPTGRLPASFGTCRCRPPCLPPLPLGALLYLASYAQPRRSYKVRLLTRSTSGALDRAAWEDSSSNLQDHGDPRRGRGGTNEQNGHVLRLTCIIFSSTFSSKTLSISSSWFAHGGTASYQSTKSLPKSSALFRTFWAWTTKTKT